MRLFVRMDRKIIKYKNNWCQTFEDLDSFVNDDISDGWELFGAPYMAKAEIQYPTCKEYEPIVCQAMVLYDDSTPLNSTVRIGQEKNEVK